MRKESTAGASLAALLLLTTESSNTVTSVQRRTGWLHSFQSPVETHSSLTKTTQLQGGGGRAFGQAQSLYNGTGRTWHEAGPGLGASEPEASLQADGHLGCHPPACLSFYPNVLLTLHATLGEKYSFGKPME